MQADRDELLFQLLDDLIAQSKNGRQADVEAVLESHPDLADDLRELLATALIAEDFGSLTGDPTLSAVSSVKTVAQATQPPPSFGGFELIQEIGRGGMGVVYSARQPSLDRNVAIKMILKGMFASAADVARFRAEAESSARLSHPNIVPVYEVGDVDGQPYFCMKLIDGVNLFQRLVDGPLPPRAAAQILAPVARAIGEAHRNGILHRDLKPSNILIDCDGRPYVTDFGLAKRINTGNGDAVSALTQSGAILGTPGYLAPEQAAGQRGVVSPATDVYCLGAILYAMLTGHPPFQATTAVDAILMSLEQDPLPPRLLNPHADVDLEVVALKCLQKPPDLRYASADALADDLEAYLANEPIAARSSQFVDVLTRAFRETHHAVVLENWGLLWMWHSLVVLLLCIATNAMQLSGVESRVPYLGIWVVGLSVWAGIFWELRRRAGPITFVERQIAHCWAASMGASMLLYAIEALLGLRVLELSPVLALITGMVFLVKAGILSGAFYIQSAIMFVTGVIMAAWQQSTFPNISVLIYGVTASGSFFFPGWKYYRQRQLRR